MLRSGVRGEGHHRAGLLVLLVSVESSRILAVWVFAILRSEFAPVKCLLDGILLWIRI